MAVTAQTKIEPAGLLAKLREPFPDHQISKLPKETRPQIDARKADKNKMVFNCTVCGGHHHKDATHLDYVGHAALTDRLLDTDIEWSWEPAGFTPEGLPAFDRTCGLWIKLTVCGVTRFGYGAADGKQGGDAVKEIIGDALRNAAMRFGAALDLWHKGGDLHADEDEPAKAPANDRNGNGLKQQLQESVRQADRDAPFPQGPCKNKTELKTKAREAWREIEGCGDPDEMESAIRAHDALLKQLRDALPDWWDGGTRAGEPYEGLSHVIERKRRDFADIAEAGGDWKNNPVLAG